MALLTSEERASLQVVSEIAYCNPFLPERVELERQLLGSDFKKEEPVQSLNVADPVVRTWNYTKIGQRLEVSVPGLRERLASGAGASERDLILYRDAALSLLYRRHLDSFNAVIEAVDDQDRRRGARTCYQRFVRDWRHFLDVPEVTIPARFHPDHVFATLFQIQRAFYHIFHFIVGTSMVAARLRSAVWQSIFTHDLRRYGRTLFERMNDVTTLITGPSGTGKELVARAIGLSGYIPFDAKKSTFAEDFALSFHPINLSALPSALVESELFGHRRGAFTGAVTDRLGWLEACRPGGSVFLDEIGDLDPAIQVKLLRVLQTRTFQPLGDTTDRTFAGRILAATNRDLDAALHDGSFREGFYYRLCSDVVTTPSLSDQLEEAPSVLGELLLFIARRVVGEDAEEFAAEVEAWIVQNLGRDYPWPGNIRELEQCVRNVLIRKEYRPPRPRSRPAREAFARAASAGALTADELMRRYCTLVYAQTGNYQEAARRLQLDRRTVKSKIDERLLAQLSEAR